MHLERIFLAAAAWASLSIAPGLANAASPQPAPQSPQTPPTAPSSGRAASTETKPAPPSRITGYTLPPDRYQKAHNLAKIHFRFAIISFVYGAVVLWLVLRWKLSAKYHLLAESNFSKRFLQALLFSPMVILTIDVLELPTWIYENWVSRQYGLSVQGWGSWFWDWAKGELISVIVGILLIWLLYSVIRKSPRRWWFYFFGSRHCPSCCSFSFSCPS